MNPITEGIYNQQFDARQNKDWTNLPAAYFNNIAQALWGHYGDLVYVHTNSPGRWTPVLSISLRLHITSEDAFDFVVDKEMKNEGPGYSVYTTLTAVDEYSSKDKFEQVLVLTLEGELQGIAYKLNLHISCPLSESDVQTLRDLGKITTEWETPRSVRPQSYNAVHCGT